MRLRGKVSVAEQSVGCRFSSLELRNKAKLYTTGLASVTAKSWYRIVRNYQNITMNLIYGLISL
ncbi:hypothetical protein EDB38_10726 [Vibrio crassostreae]|nr:hypothetical protein EDB52_10326 [Vibrio crassostreae]TCN98177.1 hypothetical protein EDB30_11491 [Vibrio crassostreae]TCT50464.1 hypothetical protein EDB39_10325 [Vibrio crassostreae]TCT50852.1 hypothetical protein EDB42_10726 [Vibrio crassostreae]TCT59541.1 hypothetical protein EDB40_10426 [Vibrio crassostreae]